MVVWTKKFVFKMLSNVGTSIHTVTFMVRSTVSLAFIVSILFILWNVKFCRVKILFFSLTKCCNIALCLISKLKTFFFFDIATLICKLAKYR